MDFFREVFQLQVEGKIILTPGPNIDKVHPRQRWRSAARWQKTLPVRSSFFRDKQQRSQPGVCFVWFFFHAFGEFHEGIDFKFINQILCAVFDGFLRICWRNFWKGCCWSCCQELVHESWVSEDSKEKRVESLSSKEWRHSWHSYDLIRPLSLQYAAVSKRCWTKDGQQQAKITKDNGRRSTRMSQEVRKDH